MSDRHAGYVVTLDEPMHEENSQRMMIALSLLKGVVSVRPLDADPGHMVAYERALAKLRMQMSDVLARL